MYTRTIIDNLLNDDLVAARQATADILEAKLAEAIRDKFDELAPTVFGEAKKAPVTDKDDDVDNDGDSDDSDEYLKNRRKVVSKAIKQDEQVGSTSAGRQRGGEHQFGVRKTEFQRADADEKDRIKRRHFANKEREVRQQSAERKRAQRERERKQAERGVNPQ